jgi:CRP-like cAMP-binding protein
MPDLSARISKITRPYLFRNGAMITDLPEKDLKMISESAKPKLLKRGEILFKQGTTPRSVVWLLSGKAKILQETPGGQRQTVYIYSDGDLIGYRQLIAGEVHPVSAVLLEDSTIMLIPGVIFKGLIDSSPHFARNVLSALARDFTVWMNRMTVFTKFPVKRRLILALLILHEQYRISGSPPGVITITRTELSEYVGASLETVVRVLNTLKGKRLLQISGRRIQILDAGGLVEMMEGEEV